MASQKDGERDRSGWWSLLDALELAGWVIRGVWTLLVWLAALMGD